MSNKNRLLGKSRFDLKEFILDNMVTIMIVIISIVGIAMSGININYLFTELFDRISRNGFLVLSLVIPVMAGLGLNFGIVVGAMAAHISLFIVVNNEWGGIGGFVLAAIISVPLAIIFGYLVGQLFNKIKGNESFGSYMLSQFAEGIYLLLFLFVIGGLVPIKNPVLQITGEESFGVSNTIELSNGLTYALDRIKLETILYLFAAIVGLASIIALLYHIAVKKHSIKDGKNYIIALVVSGVVFGLSFIPGVSIFLSTDRLQLLSAIELGVLVIVIYQVVCIVCENLLKIFKNKKPILRRVASILVAVIVYGLTYIPVIEEATKKVYLPIMTLVCIAALYVFNVWLTTTRLGQRIRIVGQDLKVANAAGINVDRIRIISVILSTVFAAWGQLIYIQNMGVFNTYQAHQQVGLYSVASILVGGATINKAKSKNAIVGVILFNILVIISTDIGKVLLGDAQLGEYFRRFITFGVIAVAMVMYAYKENRKKAQLLSVELN